MAGPNSAARSGILPSDRDTVTVKSDTVTFMSYNMTGAETVKCQWVRDLSAEFSVNYCALQEHFKTVKTTGQYFQKQFRDYSSYVIPAHREPGTASGRGKGGLVQLAEKGLAVARARVTSNSPRVQAQVLTFTSFKVLWMNAYLPCDPQFQHYDDTELIQTLSEVERIVAEFSECEVVWAADMNYDTRRDNHFTRTVRPVLQRMGLVSLWEGRNVDHTHVHTDGVSTSIIDHFLVSRPLLALVEDCGPVHRGNNLSRHSRFSSACGLENYPGGQWQSSHRRGGCQHGTVLLLRRRQHTRQSYTSDFKQCSAVSTEHASLSRLPLRGCQPQRDARWSSAGHPPGTGGDSLHIPPPHGWRTRSAWRPARRAAGSNSRLERGGGAPPAGQQRMLQSLDSCRQAGSCVFDIHLHLKFFMSYMFLS